MSAKSRFLRYASLLSKKDFIRAKRFVQKTYCFSWGDILDILISKRMDLLNWGEIEILEVKVMGKWARKIIFTSGERKYQAMVIKENRAYHPSRWGQWGVNPDSIREID